MANAGVKGGEAGTALNAIMTRLATNTKGCADELEKYGVSIYDSQGNMNSLSDILTGLSAVWDNLTDQEQANLAKTIAGTNQYSKLQTIMAGCSEQAAKGGQSFSDYASALENCSGTAGKMAGTMLDNLNGKMTLFESAADGLEIAVGEQLTPAMSDLYEVGARCTFRHDRVCQRQSRRGQGHYDYGRYHRNSYRWADGVCGRCRRCKGCYSRNRCNRCGLTWSGCACCCRCCRSDRCFRGCYECRRCCG